MVRNRGSNLTCKLKLCRFTEVLEYVRSDPMSLPREWEYNIFLNTWLLKAFFCMQTDVSARVIPNAGDSQFYWYRLAVYTPAISVNTPNPDLWLNGYIEFIEFGVSTEMAGVFTATLTIYIKIRCYCTHIGDKSWAFPSATIPSSTPETRPRDWRAKDVHQG